MDKPRKIDAILMPSERENKNKNSHKQFSLSVI